MKRLFIILPILSLLLLSGCSKVEELPSTPLPVSVQKTEIKNVDEYIEAIGTLEAYASVDIVAQAEGMLTHILFNQGEFVKYGKLLFTLDPRIYEANLESAKATLAQDTARLNYAKQYAQSYTTLAKESYVSKLSAAEAVQNVEIYTANIEADHAAIQNAETNLGYTKIKAPLSGYISLYNIDVGNYIPKDGTQPLATIKQITPIKLNFSLPSTYFEKIRCAQMKKKLLIKAFLQNKKEPPLNGELTFINNTVNEQSGMILLQGEIPNLDERGWPGQFVSLHLYVGEIENAVIVPNAALQRNEDGPFVFVVNSDMNIELKPVTTGFKFDQSTVIEKGLTGHETVVTDGQINLSPGAKVRIIQDKVKESHTKEEAS